MTTPTAKSLDVEELRTLARCLRRFGSAINPDSIQEAAVAINNLLDERAETQRQLSEMAAEVERLRELVKQDEEIIQRRLGEILNFQESLKAEREHADRLAEQLKSCKKFISYARYELEEKSEPFRQFPSQGDADSILKHIDEKIAQHAERRAAKK